MGPNSGSLHDVFNFDAMSKQAFQQAHSFVNMVYQYYDYFSDYVLLSTSNLTRFLNFASSFDETNLATFSFNL